MVRVSLMIAVLALGGCVSMLGVDATDYDKVASKIERRDDPHKQVTQTTGPVAFSGTDMFAPAYWLQASKRSGGEIAELQLHIMATVGESVYLDRVWSRGERLDLTQIARRPGNCHANVNFTSCTVSEHVGINLTLEQVRDYARMGFEAKIEGSDMAVVVDVPAPYFRAFHDALDQPAP